jgi:hypothetical protein
MSFDSAIFLREGSVKTGKSEASLALLSQTEWEALAKFALRFFHECESCAPEERFLGFFREAQRRVSKASGKGGSPEF